MHDTVTILTGRTDKCRHEDENSITIATVCSCYVDGIKIRKQSIPPIWSNISKLWFALNELYGTFSSLKFKGSSFNGKFTI